MEGRIKFENREGNKLRDILQGRVSIRERGTVAWIMGIIREVLPRGFSGEGAEMERGEIEEQEEFFLGRISWSVAATEKG